MTNRQSQWMGKFHKFYIAALAFCCIAATVSAETIIENCDRRPTVNGWLFLGDRSSCVWNEGGWMDIKPAKKTSRLFRQMQNPFKKGQKFYFEYDIMAPTSVAVNDFYVGLMTPDGKFFNNFLGAVAEKNSFSPALGKKSGDEPIIKGEGHTIPSPLIVRVAGDFDGTSKLKIKLLDLLKNMQPLAASEQTVNLDDISPGMMTVFGAGIAAGTNSKAIPFRVDNFYFSDREPNKSQTMPSFMSSDLVKISSIMPVSSLKSVRICAEIDSIIDADEVEVKGAILPDKKLRGDEIWTGTLGKVKLTKGAKSTIEYTVENLDPALWFPDAPNL